MRRVFLLVLLLAPPAASASDTDLPVAVGQRVRAREAGGHQVAGQVVEVLPDALVVRVTAHAQARRLDLSRLDRLEVSRGEHGNAGVGAVAGFVPGFILGAVFGALLCSGGGDIECGDGAAPGVALYFGTVLGAVTGVVGALVGWGIRTEHWEQVHLPGIGRVRWEPVVIPVRGGAGAGLTLRF